MWLDKGGGTFTEETCFKQHVQLVWWNQFHTLPHTDRTIIWLVAVEMSDDEDVLVLWWWLQNKKNIQRYWIHPLISDRQHNSYIVLLKGGKQLKGFYTVNKSYFDHLLPVVGLQITKNDIDSRRAVGAEERLIIMLR